jgi:hypothetical protein
MPFDIDIPKGNAFFFIAEVLWPREKCDGKYRDADKLLAQSGRKQVTVTEDFDIHISCLLS